MAKRRSRRSSKFNKSEETLEYDGLSSAVETWFNYLQICEQLRYNTSSGKHRSNDMRARDGFNDFFREWEPANEDVIKMVRKGVYELSAKGKRIKGKIEDILYDLDSRRKMMVQSSKVKVTVAASETVCNFLLPLASQRFFLEHDTIEVHVDVLSQEKVKQVGDRVADRSVDFAIAWKGYEWEYAANKVSKLPLEGSETRIFLLVHPAHDLAEQIASGRVLDLEAVSGHRIVYPDLLQLEKFALRHFRETAYRAGGVPAVINQVRTTLSLGLIPGWIWLTKELGQIYGLLTSGLDTDEEMVLEAILPPKGRKALSSECNAYLDAVSNALQTLAADWKEVDSINSELATTLQEIDNKYIYHISKGTVGGVSRPRWVESLVKGLVITGDTLEARVDWGEIGRPHLVGRIIIRTHQKGASDFMLLTAIDNIQNPPRVGSLFFSRQVTRANFLPMDVCLIGVFAYEGNDGRPTGCPVVLSSRRLKGKDLESLERSHLVSLLTYGDAKDLAD